jgi:hypothetical protein
MRGVELQRFDAQAQPLGTPQRITPPGSKVHEFDLAVNSQGQALIAWRSGDAALGDDDGPIGVVAVSASGTEERLEVTQVEGAGAPLLLVDPAAHSLGFLAVSDPGEQTTLLPLSTPGQTAPAALLGKLGNATPVAIRGDQLLLARSQGRALAFSVANCH